MPETCKRYVFNIHTVHKNPALRRIVESAYKADYCCFTGSGRSHKCDCLSRSDVKINIIKYFYIRFIRVRKTDMFKLHMTFNVAKFDGILAVRYIRRCIHDIKNTLCSRYIGYQFIVI